jgi:hypothetical protein
MTNKRTFGELYRAEGATDQYAHKLSVEEFKKVSGDVQCNSFVHFRGRGDKRHPLRHGYKNINVCSSGPAPYKQLSPFLLGPIHFKEYDATGEQRNYEATNLENLWQFSKVWTCDVNPDGSIKADWFVTRDAGWADPKPHRRRKVSAGESTLYSFWNKERLLYGEARKRIYIPYYVQLAQATDAYKQLHKLVHEGGINVQIIGYDGRDFAMGSLRACLEDLRAPFGHELVLCGMLRGERVWE